MSRLSAEHRRKGKTCVTQEREIEIEGRLSSMETTVAEIKRVVDSNMAFWRQFLGSVGGGAIVAAVMWLLKVKA